VDLIRVRDLLGHTSIKMTERYAHLMPNKLQDPVRVLDLFAEGGA
jgi:site-specific recombinase XerD